jgi:hypothetical protein
MNKNFEQYSKKELIEMALYANGLFMGTGVYGFLMPWHHKESLKERVQNIVNEFLKWDRNFLIKKIKEIISNTRSTNLMNISIEKLFEERLNYPENIPQETKKIYQMYREMLSQMD